MFPITCSTGREGKKGGSTMVNKMMCTTMVVLSLAFAIIQIHSIPPSTSEVPTPSGSRRVVYSELRGDRSGAAIHDMLYAHAYAFNMLNNTVYGGACYRKKLMRQDKSMIVHMALLKKIGLLEELPLVDCQKIKTDITIVPPTMYRNDSLFRDSQWMKHIHSIVQEHQQSQPLVRNHKHATAIHIRRGDVGPCFSTRYQPNSHYLDIINKYISPESEITIYSESRSFESIADNFTDCCSLQLDKDLGDTWLGIMNADTVIMSKSSFSYVPALLNPKSGVQIIYTPFWHAKLHNWTTVSDEILNKTELELSRVMHKAGC
jgi:hypothetical protein